ncbi:MAG: hypothetical protein KGD58_13420 [Candidatus Lokiarchaeota archaeon]|nr:hypothetical protein [Candidatus Lokiarchaeota archaeon]
MSDNNLIRDKIQEEIEKKLDLYLREHKNEAFTIRALKKRLEPYLKDFSDKDLENVLTQMSSNQRILSTQHNNEKYYYITVELNKSKQAYEEVPSIVNINHKTKKLLIRMPTRQGLREERLTIKDLIYLNHNSSVGITVFLGITLGIILIYFSNIFEGMLSISIVIITASIIQELIAKHTVSNENRSYNLPIYGIITIVIDIIGLVAIIFSGGLFPIPFFFIGFFSAIPILLTAIIFAFLGFYYRRDLRPYFAILGLFLTIFLITIYLLPIVYSLILLEFF